MSPLRKLCAVLLLLTATTEYALGEGTAAPERSGARNRAHGVEQASPVETEAQPFTSETMPRFQGKDLHVFRKWVQERVRHPKRALKRGISGRVIVSFVIDTTGRLTQIQVLLSPDQLLSDEAVRVLKRSPRWEPGRRNGQKVPIKYTMPVDFLPPTKATDTTGEK